jgi:membrane fusion protein, multidrug efflux system
MNDDHISVATAAQRSNPRRRKLAFSILAVLCLLGAAVCAAYWIQTGRYLERTDDAYVNGKVLQVTPQIGGTVLAVHAEDTDIVKAGQVLAELDHADARVALEQAETALAQTVRETHAVFANNSIYEQQIKMRQSEVDRWRQDIARRQSISDTGAIAMEEIYHARDSLKAAQASVAAAQEQLASNRTQTDGVRVESHPAVRRAASRFEDAWLAWSRGNVTSPVSGQVARRNVQIGQRVAPGTALMTVVPLEQVWVEANFKEVQLRQVKIGQPVTLQADIYGGSIDYHGRVVGLGAGTGAAFSLLPAQNASGNWIKVVQRIPVRIAIDPAELSEHPLRIGLSMQVEIDTREGRRPPGFVSEDHGQIRFATADAGIEMARARVREIIRKNLQTTAHS